MDAVENLLGNYLLHNFVGIAVSSLLQTELSISYLMFHHSLSKRKQRNHMKKENEWSLFYGGKADKSGFRNEVINKN